MSDWIHIGHGVEMQFAVLNGARVGVQYRHPHPDGRPCYGWVPFVGREVDTGYSWTVESDDPLTLSPSLLCRRCQHHGWIRDGKWVPA